MRSLEMLKSSIILSLAILSASCTTVPDSVVIQKVEIPVSVACKEEIPQEPVWCFDSLSESDDIYNKGKCLLSDRQLSKAYQAELSSKLKACK